MDVSYYSGASTIAPQLLELFKDTNDATSIGNSILGIIRAIGSAISVGVLMILGIKYMLGSAEERASYKKSMIPYIVGAVLLFAAVSLTSLVENTIGLDDVTVQEPNGGGTQGGGYDFSERTCPSCGREVIPTFSIEKHTYVCPRCGQPM